MKTLFSNHGPALKVRIMLWASMLVCIAALYGGWAIFESYGLSAGDGGILRPFGERLAFGMFVAGLGLVFAGGMMVFANIYATYLERGRDKIIIDTLTVWGIGTRRHEIDIAQVGKAAYHEGRTRSFRGPSVDAPWISLHTTGRWLPFVLDLQAEIIETGPLSVLAEGAVADWKKDRG
jgi:hypothetical protein